MQWTCPSARMAWLSLSLNGVMTSQPPANRPGTTAYRSFHAVLRWLALFGGPALFIVLAWELWRTTTIAIDAPLQDGLRAFRSHAMTRFMSGVTHFGDTEAIYAIAIGGGLLLAFKRHWRSAIYLAAAAGGAGLLTRTLKEVFERARPLDALLVKGGFAFPSGHSLLSAATYGAVAVLIATRLPRHKKVLVTVCVTIAALVGFSRAYLFVHFPSDVLAGWALGAAWALWLKPLAIGPGMQAATTPNEELRADNFDPDELEQDELQGAEPG